MQIIGCDLHARQQTLAMLDTETGEAVFLGSLLALGVFLLRVGASFLRGESSAARDRTNYIGSLASGCLLFLLVKFDYLIPHASAVVLILSLAVLGVAALVRYRSQSF
jgi:hypothetical protein